MLSNGDVSSPGVAQDGSTPQQAPPTDPLATYLKGAFKSNANYLVKSAQEFTDDKYTVKLGTQRETRTFAALIGHVTKAKVPALAKITLMATQVVIRQPQPHEADSVRALIETVATETFTDLFAPNPVPLKFEDDDWRLAWMAASDTNILGVMLTNQEWVSDLWVLREHRRQGVGSSLLARGELEIAARGHNTCRLRVVKSNAVAMQFYPSRGWQIVREFAHEKYHHAMLEMAKTLPGNLHSVR